MGASWLCPCWYRGLQKELCQGKECNCLDLRGKFRLGQGEHQEQNDGSAGRERDSQRGEVATTIISAKMATLCIRFEVSPCTVSLFHLKVSVSQLGTVRPLVSSFWQKHAITLFFWVATCPPQGLKQTNKQTNETPHLFCLYKRSPEAILPHVISTPQSLLTWGLHNGSSKPCLQLKDRYTVSILLGTRLKGRYFWSFPSSLGCTRIWLPLLSRPFVPLLSSQVQAVVLRG